MSRKEQRKQTKTLLVEGFHIEVPKHFDDEQVKKYVNDAMDYIRNDPAFRARVERRQAFVLDATSKLQARIERIRQEGGNAAFFEQALAKVQKMKA